MADITLTVSRQSNGGDTYYLVDNGNTPTVKRNLKVTWEPENGGTYDSGTFTLLGVGRYDSGPFALTQMEVDAEAGTVSAKAKSVSKQTPVKYLLMVLDEPTDPNEETLVYLAYGGIPVTPWAGGERPQPPPEVVIDP